jgi:uncharacterized protein YceK
MFAIRKFVLVMATMALVSAIVGCSKTVTAAETKSTEVVVITAPETPSGAADYVWEEPMVSIVDVPPGLDPEGNYYVPAHRAVVQIRQGRWRPLEEKAQ